MPKTIHQGFNILAPEPADGRTRVQLFTDLALIPIKYDRMKTYVIAEDKEYRYFKGGSPEWVAISAAASGTAQWGGISGNIESQTDLINKFGLYALSGHTHSTVPNHTHPTADIEDIDGQVTWNRAHVAPNFIITGSGGGTADTEAPILGVLSELFKSNSSAQFGWSAATDNVGVTQYYIYQDNIQIDIIDDTQLNYTVTGLTAETAYLFGVKAKDAAGNLSTMSTINITTNAETFILTYSGKNSSGTVPDEAAILLGTSYNIPTNGSVQVNTPTTASEYAWVAIPIDAVQTGAKPANWFISLPFNFGAIDDFSFIKDRGIVTVGAQDYYLFMYDFPSEVLLPLQINK